MPAALLLPGLAALTGCSDAAGGAGAWGAALLLAALAGAAGFAIGALREKRSADAALRGARGDAQALARLVDAWTWHTDAAHRLQRLHPPPGGDGAEWSRLPPAGAPLWERFESAVPGDVAGLRARLESQAPFGELRVRRTDDGSHWLLRAVPRHDDLGRFAGFDGTARACDASEAMRADQGALRVMLAALDGPALLAWGDGTPAGWAVRDLNAAAQTWLDEALPRWEQVLARLPPALRDAIAQPGTDGTAACDGWLMRRFAVETAQGLLLVRPPRAGGDDDGAESASFSFTVSHDLRAPIRVVEGFTRILKEDYGRSLDRVGNDHLDRVLGAAARMNLMIDALLTLARLSQQPLARQPVNLSQLAGYVVDDLRRGAPERAAEIEIEPDLRANGDPTLLRLVLENLLGNAWKYSAKCKKAHIVFGTATHEGRRAFVVRDNGAGFDMRSADRLFGLFQRLHSANDFPGTGVGLASVKRIVRRHGGDIWADSEPGRGSAFFFTLRE